MVYTVAGAGWTASVKMPLSNAGAWRVWTSTQEGNVVSTRWTSIGMDRNLYPFLSPLTFDDEGLFRSHNSLFTEVNTHTPDPKSERKWRKTKWWKERNGRLSCCFTPRKWISRTQWSGWSSTVWKELTMFLPLCCLASLQFRKVRRHFLFSPLFYPQTGGTNLEERGRESMGDPGLVFTTMLELIVINPT